MKKTIILLIILIYSIFLFSEEAVLLYENCESISDWTITTYSGNEDSTPWDNSTINRTLNNSTGRFLWSAGTLNIDEASKVNASINSQYWDCTNYQKVILTYTHYYNQGAYDSDEGQVRVSRYGGYQYPLITYDADTPNGQIVNLDISSYAASQNDVRVHFYFDSPATYWLGFGEWLIDNISVKGYSIDGFAGKAMDFDGDNDYIEIPNEADYDFTNEMTVEAWIKVDEFDRNWQAFVTKGDSSWRIQRYYNTNQIEFVAGGVSIYSTTEVNDGKWHHIAGIHNNSVTVLMIDGNLEGMSWNAGTTAHNDYPVLIGENAQQPGRYFDGQIDEVRVWNTFRSVPEIQENMYHPVNIDEPGLVSYWQFNEESGYALDPISLNNGTVNGSLREDSSIPFGKGASEIITVESIGTYPVLNGNVQLDFTAISESSDFLITRIDSSPNILPDIDTTFSEQYWILDQIAIPATFEANIGLILQEDISAELPEDLGLGSREPNSHESWSSLQIASEIDIPTNRATFENISSTGQLIIGKNSIPPLLTSIFPENTSVNNTLSPNFTITFDENISTGAGNILLFDSDDNLIEALPASNSDIVDNVVEFQFVNNLDLDTSYYILIEETAIHYFGSYFEGISSSSEWTFSTMGIKHESGNCLELNGTNQYAEFEEGLIPASGDFTVSLWAKADSDQTGYREIISQNAGTGEDFYLGFAANGNVRVGDNWSDSGVSFPLDNGWHYYAVVKNSADTELYIDGALKASKGSAINNPQGITFRIGRQYGSYGEYFQGQIDEIKIWDSELCADDIRNNMHLTSSEGELNLISYIQFNDQNEFIVDLIGKKSGVYTGSKVTSTIEVGNGIVDSQSISTIGTLDFPAIGVSINVTSINSETEFYVTKLSQAPTIVPDGEEVFNSQFWAIHPFGDDAVIADVSFTPLETIDGYYENYTDMFYVNHRETYFQYDWWHRNDASSVDSALNTATLNGRNNFGLFILSQDIPVHIVSILPDDGAVVQSDVVFEVTFDYGLWITEGYLRIFRLTDDSLFEEMNVTDLPIVGDDGEIILVDPQNELEPGVTYYVNIDSDCIFGFNETTFGGINDNYSWNFTMEGGLLDPPENLIIEIIGTDVQLSWDAVTGATSYKVYSSDDPNSGFLEDTSGTFVNESWSSSRDTAKKFYFVKSCSSMIRDGNTSRSGKNIEIRKE